MIKNSKKQAVTKFLLIAFVLLMPAHAYATFVTPKRVMIDDKKRTGVVNIYNQTKQTQIYTFSWEDLAQSPDGKSISVKEGETLAGYNSAKDMLLYSPRQVMVKPGQSQKIRIFAKRPANLPEGEYHSHLVIRPTPPPKKALGEGNGEGVVGTMEVLVSMAIPVFVRNGATHLDFEITDATMIKKEGKNYLRFAASNNSTRSLYAKRTLVCTKANGETENIPLIALKMYTEAKTITKDLYVGAKKDPIIDSCQSFHLDLYGQNDFEYNNKLIKSVPVQK